MFALFERLLKPTAAPEHPEPPAGLVAFYWHFVRQAKALFAALFVTGLVVALLDTLIPVFIGRIVTLMHRERSPQPLFARALADAARHGAGAAGRCARSR